MANTLLRNKGKIWPPRVLFSNTQSVYLGMAVKNANLDNFIFVKEKSSPLAIIIMANFSITCQRGKLVTVRTFGGPFTRGMNELVSRVSFPYYLFLQVSFFLCFVVSLFICFFIPTSSPALHVTHQPRDVTSFPSPFLRCSNNINDTRSINEIRQFCQSFA